jgi:hypothetical protein
VQAGDEYVVELATTGVAPGLTLPDGSAARVLEAAFLPRPAGSELVLDATTAPPGGGRASLRARFPAAGSVRLPQWYPPPPPHPGRLLKCRFLSTGTVGANTFSTGWPVVGHGAVHGFNVSPVLAGLQHPSPARPGSLKPRTPGCVGAKPSLKRGDGSRSGIRSCRQSFCPPTSVATPSETRARKPGRNPPNSPASASPA